MLQNATPLRKWAPWPPNISHEHVSCTAPATENASLQILFESPTPAIVFGNATKPSRFAHFCDKIANPLHLPRRTTSERQKVVRTCGVFNIFDISTFSTSQLPKVVRRWCALYILTWKCASRHNGVHFFDISTSKSGPNLVCFVHFDFEMCFAPQLRAIFHPHLASWLRTRRFSEPTFRPSGASNHWKNTVFRDFPTFSRICICFLLALSLLLFSLRIFLFSLPLSCSAFHLSILSEVWLPNFLRLLLISLLLLLLQLQHTPLHCTVVVVVIVVVVVDVVVVVVCCPLSVVVVVVVVM